MVSGHDLPYTGELFALFLIVVVDPQIILVEGIDPVVAEEWLARNRKSGTKCPKLSWSILDTCPTDILSSFSTFTIYFLEYF
jgi:hypothetical protein